MYCIVHYAHVEVFAIVLPDPTNEARHQHNQPACGIIVHGHAAIGSVLADLIQYTKNHFELEGRFLENMQYPEIAGHKAKHEALTQKAMKLRREFDRANTAIATEVMNFMLAWLTNHILHTDKRYSAFSGENASRETRIKAAAPLPHYTCSLQLNLSF